MHKYQFLKRLLPVTAILAVLILVASSTKAFATFPGESSKWNQENVNGQTLQTLSQYSEARTVGSFTLIRMWRGESDDQVWFSFGNGPSAAIGNFNLGSTRTYLAPVIVPYGQNSYMALHVGTDDHIYYAMIYLNNSGEYQSWTGYWTVISGQTTPYPVSAVQYNVNCGCIYLVYAGYNNLNVYGMWFDGSTWHDGGSISNGQIYGWPSVTYNPIVNSLTIVGMGTNSVVWVTSQLIGASSWPDWSSTGLYTLYSPTIATDNVGNFIIGGTQSNTIPWYALFDEDFNFESYEADPTNWRTNNPVTIATNGYLMYALIIGLDHVANWRQLFNPYAGK
ncbi:hypothetical protein [Granulicella sp. L60]|uniref:hypothetical protein n=1 Tax=Granulicella sp. L60 TaxID=1641866 RepID=UPI00131B798A|nr:hypothetical protein [Granulicella sp. L60]